MGRLQPLYCRVLKFLRECIHMRRNHDVQCVASNENWLDNGEVNHKGKLVHLEFLSCTHDLRS